MECSWDLNRGASAILKNEQSGETRPSSHCSLLSRKILFVERFFDLVGKTRQIDI